jgi:hypothetical protein
MPMPALKQQWREIFDKEPPPYNRRFLESRLAYRIQELAYGGLKPETVARLEALGEEFDGGRVEVRRRRLDDRVRRLSPERHVDGRLGAAGYQVKDRKLLIDEAEAAKVRWIFGRFAECGSATTVARDLNATGFVNKYGQRLDKGRICKLLNNRVCIGEAVHKGESIPGEHQAIVSRALWDREDE